MKNKKLMATVSMVSLLAVGSVEAGDLSSIEPAIGTTFIALVRYNRDCERGESMLTASYTNKFKEEDARTGKYEFGMGSSVWNAGFINFALNVIDFREKPYTPEGCVEMKSSLEAKGVYTKIWDEDGYIIK